MGALVCSACGEPKPVRFAEPADGAALDGRSDAPLTIRFEGDAAFDTLHLDGVAIAGTPPAAKGLEEGEHRLEARVGDRVVGTVRFTIDRTPPTLEVLNIRDGVGSGTTGAPVPLVVRASDASGIAAIEATAGRAPVVLERGPDGLHRGEVPVAAPVAITIAARDAVGIEAKRKPIRVEPGVLRWASSAPPDLGAEVTVSALEPGAVLFSTREFLLRIGLFGAERGWRPEGDWSNALLRGAVGGAHGGACARIVPPAGETAAGVVCLEPFADARTWRWARPVWPVALAAAPGGAWVLTSEKGGADPSLRRLGPGDAARTVGSLVGGAPGLHGRSDGRVVAWTEGERRAWDSAGTADPDPAATTVVEVEAVPPPPQVTLPGEALAAARVQGGVLGVWRGPNGVQAGVLADGADTPDHVALLPGVVAVPASWAVSGGLLVHGIAIKPRRTGRLMFLRP
jgi:hypothetical protein